MTLWFAFVGRFRDALAIGEPFVAIPESALDAGGFGDAMFGLGLAYCETGQHLKALHAFSSARDAFHSIDHHLMLYVSAINELRHVWLSYWPERAEEREDLIVQSSDWERRAREMLFPPVPILITPIASLLAEGRWNDVLNIAGQPGVRSSLRNRVFSDHEYAAVAYYQGDHELAWELVQYAFPQGHETEPGSSFANLYEPLHRLAIDMKLDAGDLEEARAWLEAYDRWVVWSGASARTAEAGLLWARFHLLNDNPESARDCATTALSIASEPPRPLVMAQAQRFLGTLDVMNGQFTSAEVYLGAALAITDTCTAPYERALTLVEMAVLFEKTGNTGQGLAMLDEAESICTSLNALPVLGSITACRNVLQGHRSRARYPAGLTPREVEVLQLVATGLTDAEVAEQLYISRRTVTSHLTSIYTKLGVSSRASATRFAVEQNLTHSQEQ